MRTVVLALIAATSWSAIACAPKGMRIDYPAEQYYFRAASAATIGSSGGLSEATAAKVQALLTEVELDLHLGRWMAGGYGERLQIDRATLADINAWSAAAQAARVHGHFQGSCTVANGELTAIAIAEFDEMYDRAFSRISLEATLNVDDAQSLVNPLVREGKGDRMHVSGSAFTVQWRITLVDEGQETSVTATQSMHAIRWDAASETPLY